MTFDFSEKIRQGETFYLRLKIRPGAAKTAIKNMLADGTVKIDIKAVPERGAANRELMIFLAQTLGLSSEKIKIISGAGDRTKLVRINP